MNNRPKEFGILDKNDIFELEDYEIIMISDATVIQTVYTYTENFQEIELAKL